MLRCPRAFLIVLAAAGCTSRDGSSVGPPVAPPSPAAVARCQRGAVALIDAVREVSNSDKFFAFTDRPYVSDLACADLYRQPTCAAAWRDAFAVGNVEDDPASKIAAVCAAAYCPRLPLAPSLCAHRLGSDGPDIAPRLEALRELDTAILKLEGLDADLARMIAARAAVFGASATRRVERAKPGEDRVGMPDPHRVDR